MARQDAPRDAAEALTLDEVAPRRHDPQPGASRPARSRRRTMAIVAALLVVLVASGATVAAVAGPAPDRPVGEGVALVADAAPAPTTSVTGAPTTVVPTTVTAAPEGDNADIAPTDCADDEMCGEITPSNECGDAGMCGEIRTDGQCADGEMCGDIPAPTTCADPTMCGEIVPEPVPAGG